MMTALTLVGDKGDYEGTV